MFLILISIIAVIAFGALVLFPGLYLAGWLGTMVDRYPPLSYVLGGAVALNFAIAVARTPALLLNFCIALGVLAVAFCLVRAIRS